MQLQIWHGYIDYSVAMTMRTVSFLRNCQQHNGSEESLTHCKEGLVQLQILGSSVCCNYIHISFEEMSGILEPHKQDNENHGAAADLAIGLARQVPPCLNNYNC